LNNRNN